MSGIILDGKLVASEIRNDLKKIISSHTSEKIRPPFLRIVRVGNDPAGEIYIRNKVKACEEVGINVSVTTTSEQVNHEELHRLLPSFSCEPEACIVQLPLPKHLDPSRIAVWLNKTTDVDGFAEKNVAALYTGQTPANPPCTPAGIMYLLKYYNIPLESKHAVIVGRSNIVGRPLSAMLLKENCTITVCHSYTKDLPAYTRQADILVSAVGKPNLITADMVKPGAAVIDVGINRVNGKTVGDVSFENVKDVAGWITPVPGGVGPMTVAMLLCNVVNSWLKVYQE